MECGGAGCYLRVCLRWRQPGFDIPGRYDRSKSAGPCERSILRRGNLSSDGFDHDPIRHGRRIGHRQHLALCCNILPRVRCGSLCNLLQLQQRGRRLGCRGESCGPGVLPLLPLHGVRAVGVEWDEHIVRSPGSDQFQLRRQYRDFFGEYHPHRVWGPVNRHLDFRFLRGMDGNADVYRDNSNGQFERCLARRHELLGAGHGRSNRRFVDLGRFHVRYSGSRQLLRRRRAPSSRASADYRGELTCETWRFCFSYARHTFGTKTALAIARKRTIVVE